MTLLETAKRLYRLKLNQTLPEYKIFISKYCFFKAKIIGLYGFG